MFTSLRSRLIISHILPIILVIPLLEIAIIYVIETRIILPQLAQNLTGDARLLSEISRAEYELWGNPLYFELLLSRVQLDPALRVMFLTEDGRLLYSSDPEDVYRLGSDLDITSYRKVRSGDEIVLTNYSPLRLSNTLLDVISPVKDSNQQVVGAVRVTYQIASAYDLFSHFRNLISIVLIINLLLGALLGSVLALSISRPVKNVTQAIYDLASGSSSSQLPEKGPQEIRNLSRAVNFLVERLHDMESSRRQLLANLVHELGRPLGALRSAIHALSIGAAKDPQLLDELTTGMDEEAARLQKLLEDVVHLHDQTLGKLELKLEPVDLSQWLARVLRPWQEAAQEKRLSWQTDLPANLPVIQADPSRLSQVIGNLVSNAIKYTPPGGTVAISAGYESQGVWIKVSDTGPGIPEDEQERIFEPFYRGSQGRRFKQGMGLGLSISRDVILAHKGSLEMNSILGEGSEFIIHFPLLPTS